MADAECFEEAVPVRSTRTVLGACNRLPLLALRSLTIHGLHRPAPHERTHGGHQRHHAASKRDPLEPTARYDGAVSTNNAHEQKAFKHPAAGAQTMARQRLLSSAMVLHGRCWSTPVTTGSIWCTAPPTKRVACNRLFHHASSSTAYPSVWYRACSRAEKLLAGPISSVVGPAPAGLLPMCAAVAPARASSNSAWRDDATIPGSSPATKRSTSRRRNTCTMPTWHKRILYCRMMYSECGTRCTRDVCIAQTQGYVFVTRRLTCDGVLPLFCTVFCKNGSHVYLERLADPRIPLYSAATSQIR